MAPRTTALFILMPLRGFSSADMRHIDAARPMFTAAARERLPAPGRAPVMRVVHAIDDTGPKLVEIGAEEIAALRVSDPGVKAMPLVRYELMRLPRLEVESRVRPARAAAAGTRFTLRCVDAATGGPVPGVQVAAFTDFAQRRGDGGITDARGEVHLGFGPSPVTLEVLVAYGPSGHWGFGQRGVTLRSGAALPIAPVDLAVPDFVAHLYDRLPPDGGEGVTVGVIDTGVDDTHRDLHVAGGEAFVISEEDAGGPGPAERHGDHGTHVAGIIASTGGLGGVAPGKRGIAPRVRLMSYRVFPNRGEGADNYDIIRAIDRGVKDGCDLLNLSLGSPVADEAVHAAIQDAFDRGTVCVVAAGNDHRSPVAYPAAWDVAVGVSSLGRVGTYPPTSSEVLDEVAPYSPRDPAVYVSAFSNVGPPIDVCGPGGGIVSTLPGDRYGVMSGTSMACPAVTGVLASLLSSTPEVRDLPRDRARSVAIVGLITAHAQPLGFIQPLEGVGLMQGKPVPAAGRAG